jgi:hypothetical protein
VGLDDSGFRIFISYRREDTAGYAGRLYDSLRGYFAEDELFMDVDTIAPGVDFVDAIENAVSVCDVLLALIGPAWVSSTDEEGRRRLEIAEDFVRVEIAAALHRNIRVVPLLVQDTRMPTSDELPAALASLARRNAHRVDNQRWHRDVRELVEHLNALREAKQASDSQVGSAAGVRGERPRASIPQVTVTSQPDGETRKVEREEAARGALDTKIVGERVRQAVSPSVRHLVVGGLLVVALVVAIVVGLRGAPTGDMSPTEEECIELLEARGASAPGSAILVATQPRAVVMDGIRIAQRGGLPGQESETPGTIDDCVAEEHPYLPSPAVMLVGGVVVLLALGTAWCLGAADRVRNITRGMLAVVAFLAFVAMFVGFTESLRQVDDDECLASLREGAPPEYCQEYDYLPPAPVFVVTLALGMTAVYVLYRNPPGLRPITRPQPAG